MTARFLLKVNFMDAPESKGFATLADDPRETVDTATAAQYLNRSPQTLRSWASLENGPLRPRRVNGRLAWSMSQIREVVAARRPIKDNHP